MKVINSLPELEQAKLHNLVVALGNFDGVHLGHRKLITEAVRKAKEINGLSAVLTFEPHPLKVLAPERFPKLLNTLNQRIRHFASLGVDIVILLPFTRDLASSSPRHFAEQILFGRMHVAHVFVGFNYSFGHGGKGDPSRLRELGLQLGFAVSVVEPLEINGILVSSTEIRQFLERGDVEQAEHFLGYWPSLPGVVVSGDQRGRTIGFPTANVEPPEDLLVPANGVYAAWIELEDGMHPSMVNIGSIPTFKDWNETTIEAHIFNFQRDLYDQEVEVYFRHRLRDERKFNGVEELLKQLKDDEARAYNLLKNDKMFAVGNKQRVFCI